MVVVACAGTALLTAACSGRSEAKLDPSPTGSPAPSSSPVTSDTGLVLRTRTSGGIAGLGGPGSLPDFSLYGDGRAIAGSGALTEYRLTPKALRRLTSEAMAAGLATPRTVVDPQMADAMYTVITFVAGGRPRTTRLVQPTRDAQVAAFLSRLEPAKWPSTDLAAGPRPYRPSAVAALAVPGSAAGGRRWPFAPLGSGPQVGTRTCTLLTGADARRAERLTSGRWSDWTDHGRSYRVTLRPLLPDEADCSALA
ncbi:hypothetical protein NE236_22225 [Actinoallomurus purpureus]|uniref:hypothetical protein n=1 Tax=Actinoallomurus purpureus TaxID=478114 RepID=UPI0020937FA2|nr:hypothetical protein [Actinoallomurus purpureus]MCO6007699.1 hypothetical protein [Actinoallomurus purpureus]